VTLDILAVCAHPDDAELHCGGLLLQAQRRGAAVGVLDLTRGEAASRGTPELRRQESEAASRILGLTLRDNLGLPDARLQVDQDHLTPIIERIRSWRPRLVVTSHSDDHHPDHEACGTLVRHACYLAGIGNHPAGGSPHRPEQVLYYLDRVDHRPHLVQDVSDVFEQKLAAVRCYASQLYSAPTPASAPRPEPAAESGLPMEPEQSSLHATPLAAPDYLATWQARHRHFGSLIGVRYGEAYVLRSPVPLRDPLSLLWGREGIV
jgi:bacillithiol biosynthesis deacetylase BshB1